MTRVFFFLTAHRLARHLLHEEHILSWVSVGQSLPGYTKLLLLPCGNITAGWKLDLCNASIASVNWLSSKAGAYVKAVLGRDGIESFPDYGIGWRSWANGTKGEK